MEFKREIAAALGEALGIRCTVVGGRGAYFENVRRIASFSAEEVVLRGRREVYAVTGKSLSLGKYCAGDVVIFGDIVRIERRGG